MALGKSILAQAERSVVFVPGEKINQGIGDDYYGK